MIDDLLILAILTAERRRSNAIGLIIHTKKITNETLSFPKMSR